MQLRDRGHDRETQTGTALIGPRPRRIGAVERLEHMWQIFSGDP
jgi:hypothetical protein